MPNLARKKIAVLIAAGYTLALLLATALGLLSILGMDTLKSMVSDLYEHPFTVSNAALETKTWTVQARNRMFRILLFDDPQKTEGWLAEIAILDKNAAGQLGRVKANFLGDIRRVEETEALLQQERDIRNRAIELSLRGQRGEAARLILETGNDLFKQANEHLDYVIDFARRKASNSVDEAERKAAVEINRTLWFLAGLAVVIGLTGWLVVRRVMAMVRHVERLENNLLESRHQAEISAYARSLIEASLDPLVTISPQGKITDVNRATEQATGRGRGELVGADFADYFTEPGKAHEGYRKVFSEGFVIDYPLILRHRDGRLIEVLYNASLYLDESGNVSGVFAAARDVTERNCLAREREQYYKFFMLSVDPMCIADPYGCFKHVNPAWVRLTGYAEDELVAKPFLEFVLPEDRQKTLEEMKLQVTARPSFHFENRYLCKDGTVVFLSWTAYFDKNDGVTYATAHNHTEFHAAEEALRTSDKRLRFSIESAQIGLWELDLLNQTAWRSPHHDKIFGYEALLPTWTYEMFLEHVLPEDRPAVDRKFTEAITGASCWNFECRIKRKDGAVRWIWAKGEPELDALDKPVRMFGVVQDITERKQAEARLAASESRLRAIIETEPECIKVVDSGGRLRQMNPAGLAMIEADAFEQVAGQPVLGLIAPAYQQSYAQMHERVIAGEPQKMEYVMIGLKGRPLWLETHAVPMLDGAEVVHLAITRDISDRKQAEEKIRQINAELERRVADRTAELEAANKELEAFSYSVSHDLRTPLRAIDGFSLILLEDYAGTLDDEGKRLLNVVRNNTARMSQLIDDILRFSRAGRTEMSFSEIDMEKIVREVLDELGPLAAGHSVQINLDGLPAAMGDRAMMRQVVGNLLSNAIKFSSKQEDARIDIGGRTEGGSVVYYVKDNGVGFDMRYAGKLFGVFQRLHGVDEFEGTGIGLAIVKRVIARHGGAVWAEGEVGKGAAFYFSIPLKER